MVLVVGVVLAGCSSNGATRDDAGQIVERGEVDIFSFAEGDCFDDPPELAASSGAIEVPGVEGLPCSDPHDNEVIAVRDIGPEAFPIADGAAFPGALAIELVAVDLCVSEFEPFVGFPFEQSILDVGAFWPTEQTWDVLNDREVVCFVFRVDFAPMTGTQRDAGI